MYISSTSSSVSSSVTLENNSSDTAVSGGSSLPSLPKMDEEKECTPSEDLQSSLAGQPSSLPDTEITSNQESSVSETVPPAAEEKPKETYGFEPFDNSADFSMANYILTNQLRASLAANSNYTINLVTKACRAMVTPDPILIGSYQGFDLLLHYDTFAKQHRMTLKHQLSHFVSLGTDILGNITRLNNRLNGFEESLADTKEKLRDIQKQIAVGMMEVEKPWPQEDELDQKMKRLAELNSLLNVDKQEKNKEEMER